MKSEVMAEFGKKRIIDHDFPPPNKYVGSENNKEYAFFLAFGLNPTLMAAVEGAHLRAAARWL